MAIVTGCELGVELCRVLKLDPKVTADITIISKPGDVARVEVKRFVTSDEARSIAEVLERYELSAKT